MTCEPAASIFRSFLPKAFQGGVMPAGRSPSQVDFIRLLAAMLELKGAKFAHRVGKTAANAGAYLAGSKTPGRKVLLSALRHAFERDVKPLSELESVDKANDLPTTPGIYSLYDSSGSAIYVGQAHKLEAGSGASAPKTNELSRAPRPSTFEERIQKIQGGSNASFCIPCALSADAAQSRSIIVAVLPQPVSQ
jgi:hypothetical protein